MSIYGNWITTAGGTGTLSPAINLGRDWDFLNIYIPDVTNDALTVKFSLKVADASGGTYFNLGDSSSLTTFAVTGDYYTTFDLGGFQFIKIGMDANDSSTSRNYKTRGWRR